MQHTDTSSHIPHQNEGGRVQHTAWAAQDVLSIIDAMEAGTYRRPCPTLGRRQDGAAMFYPGRVHSVSGPSEAGKSWLVMAAASEAMNEGHIVTFIDFEDTPETAIHRLMVLGTPADTIRRRFRYVGPDKPLTEGMPQVDLLAACTGAALVIIDTVTAAMSTMGLMANGGTNSDTNVSAFLRMLPNPIAERTGAAVVMVDHINKIAEGIDQRHASGSHYKLGGVTGAAYIMKSVEPMRPGATGRAVIQVAKDRPGSVRAACTTAKGGMQVFADFVCASMDDGSVIPTLYVPRTDDEQEEAKRAALEEQITAAVKAQPGMGKRGLRAAVSGKHDDKDAAIAGMIQTGRLVVRQRGNKAEHYLPDAVPAQ